MSQHTMGATISVSFFFCLLFLVNVYATSDVLIQLLCHLPNGRAVAKPDFLPRSNCFFTEVQMYFIGYVTLFLYDCTC